MIRSIKKHLYFVVAHYFAFWARFVLWRWHPRIILITGSSGKTTVLHLLEAQLGDKAIYTHHANGAISIPFHVLGLPPNVPSRASWPIYFLKAPFQILRTLPNKNIYVVEADCDRPNEGKFTSKFLKPEVCLWVSVSRTHSMNFESLVKSKKFSSYEKAIAHEFGYFPEHTKKLVLANGDQKLLASELSRVHRGVEVKAASVKNVSKYQLTKNKALFTINGQTIHVPGLQPKKLGVSLQLVNDLLKYLSLPFDSSYSKFEVPPGRSNMLDGKKNTVLIDSTYNTGLDATAGVLELFANYPSEHKWLVIGDILEQGGNDQTEHEELAKILAGESAERLILLGRRTKKYTYPKLQSKKSVVSFENPKEVLDYLESNLEGGEAVLFKGAQGLEGVVEQLLANKSDANKLVRREATWVKRRQDWGLPR